LGSGKLKKTGARGSARGKWPAETLARGKLLVRGFMGAGGAVAKTLLSVSPKEDDRPRRIQKRGG